MLFNINHVIDNKYKIIDWIGEGGFGEVYKIQDLISKDFKALKCLLPQFVEEHPELADLFDKEAKIAMQVDNKNVVKIFSTENTVYRDNQVKFLTMEYAVDGDLDKYLKRQETYLSKEELFVWIKQLLLGLKAINKKLIHRDIKPKNILIFGNILKISDFGLSKFIEELTRTKTFKGMGTPLYMAPEFWENLDTTISVDQYSMGIVFYVLATLKHPFLPIPSNVDQNEFLKEKHLYTMPGQPEELNPELQKKLSSLIMRMIEKDPKNRYQNLDEILNSLENIQTPETQDLPPQLVEIVEVAQKSEQKIKKEELRRASERKKQEEESNKIQKIFDFHCKKLLTSFDEIIDTINIQIAPAKIEKFRIPKQPFPYKLEYNFHDLTLDIFIERTDGVNEVSNIIGWGYCYIHDNQDGFNLLLQQSSNSSYAEWLCCTIRDQALWKSAKYLNPHAVKDIVKFDDALRGLRAMHLYEADLKNFNESIFLDLVKKLVSL